MYKFQFSIVVDYIKQNYKSLYRYAGMYDMSRGTIERYAKGNNEIPLQFYIDFLNRHRLAPGLAIRTDDVDCVEDFGPYQIPESRYIPIRFEGTRLHDYFNEVYNSVGGDTHVDLARNFDTTVQTIYSWCTGYNTTKKKGSIKVSTLLDICNMYHINVSDFIYCPCYPVPSLFKPVKLSQRLIGKMFSDMQNRIVEQELLIQQMRSALERKIELLNQVAHIPDKAPHSAVHPYSLPSEIIESLKNDTAQYDDKFLDVHYIPENTICVTDVIDDTVLHIYGNTDKKVRKYSKRKD